MLESSVAVLKMSGYYSQLYNSITQPGQVWRVSKYFLRRWGPYLGPTRFWTVITARQLCYRNGDQDWFAGYDAAVANEVHLSRAHYRRLKSEMEADGGPLSLFITRQPTTYHVVNGKTRPQPTVYRVRLDDPLTPADGAYLAGWLRQQTVRRRGADVADLLIQAADLSRQELLDPFPAPTGVGGPASFEPITVRQVVRQVFGGHVADQPAVIKAAEGLHAHLTESDFVGKQYFRKEWMGHLKAGPAFLQVYLRSRCFFNEQTGELRNRVTVDRQQLALTLGVKPNTISDWLKTLATVAPQQPLPPFITLLEKGRTADNSYYFTYECGMIDPLTPDDLARYEAAVAAEDPDDPLGAGPLEGGKSENERHSSGSLPPSRSENERHGGADTPPPQFENERHKDDNGSGSRSENERYEGAKFENERFTSTGEPQNERHAEGVDPNLRGAAPENEPGLMRECVPFKYFPTLLKLQQEEISTWLAAAGGKTGSDRLSDSLTQIICRNRMADLCDFLDIDPGSPTRRRLQDSGLTPADGVGWWLYAHTQPGLERPLHFVIARTAAGVPPPEPFAALATLSLEGWVSFAVSAQLPHHLRPDWGDQADLVRCRDGFGEAPLPLLPKMIAAAAEPLVDAVYERRLAVSDLARPNPSKKKQEGSSWWAVARATLAGSQPAAVFDIFIASLAAEVDEGGGRLLLRAADESGRAFLEQGLRPAIETALAEAAGRPVKVDFAVAGVPAGEDAGVAHQRSLWKDVKEALALQMSRATYEQWLENSVLLEMGEEGWCVGVETAAAQAWLDGRLRPLVEKTTRLVTGRQELKVVFVVGGSVV